MNKKMVIDVILLVSCFAIIVVSIYASESFVDSWFWKLSTGALLLTIFFPTIFEEEKVIKKLFYFVILILFPVVISLVPGGSIPLGNGIIGFLFLWRRY